MGRKSKVKGEGLFNPKNEIGEEGFSKHYWNVNYEESEDMDGIGNAEEHCQYLKGLLNLEGVSVDSLIDFGFGLGHLFEEMIATFRPRFIMGIEPSDYPFNLVKRRGLWKPAYPHRGNIMKMGLLKWTKDQSYKKILGDEKAFDLGLCTSVLQYLPDDDIDRILPVMAKRVKFLYLTVPTDKELKKQVEDLDFKDEYAIRRGRSRYFQLIRKHFTFLGGRLLESKRHFNESNTLFSDLLFRF